MRNLFFLIIAPLLLTMWNWETKAKNFKTVGKESKRLSRLSSETSCFLRWFVSIHLSLFLQYWAIFRRFLPFSNNDLCDSSNPSVSHVLAELLTYRFERKISPSFTYGVFIIQNNDRTLHLYRTSFSSVIQVIYCPVGLLRMTFWQQKYLRQENARCQIWMETSCFKIKMTTILLMCHTKMQAARSIKSKLT